MITQENALQLIQASIASLRRAGLIEEDITVTGDTVLLGPGSALDSIAFVTFVTDIEERLNRETGQDLYIVLTDIHEFNIESAHLSVATLARYVAALAGSQS